MNFNKSLMDIIYELKNQKFDISQERKVFCDF